MRYRCQYESRHPVVCETRAEVEAIYDDYPAFLATMIVAVGIAVVATFAALVILFAISRFGG